MQIRAAGASSGEHALRLPPWAAVVAGQTMPAAIRDAQTQRLLVQAASAQPRTL